MNKQIRTLVFTALFAALIFVSTWLIHIPFFAGNGYVHVGDVFIYIAASVLPLPYAMVAAAFGGAFADLASGYAIYMIPTLIVKVLLTLSFSNKKDRILTPRNLIACGIGALITVVGYLLAELLLYGPVGCLATIPGNAVQGIGSALLFVVIGAAFDVAKLKTRFLDK